MQIRKRGFKRVLITLLVCWLSLVIVNGVHDPRGLKSAFFQDLGNNVIYRPKLADVNSEIAWQRSNARPFCIPGTIYTRSVIVMRGPPINYWEPPSDPPHGPMGPVRPAPAASVQTEC